MPHRLLSLIAPPLCGVCGDGCGSAEAVCRRCHAEIAAGPPQHFSGPGVDHAWAAAPYEGIPRDLVAALKFRRRLALAAVVAESMAALAPAHGTLVPVPADPLRLRLRGFDPATLIAQALAQRLKLPLSHCLVRRHRRRQVGQARAQRLNSDLGVRAITNAPANAILIDDVATTGATLAACARALRDAGSEEVLALTFARA